MDVLTQAQRSYNMSRIRGRWTAQERAVHDILKGNRVRHRMHPPLPGKPDLLVLPDLAVYLHGCFWHGCATCYVPPKSREDYWLPKIERNRERDTTNEAAARKAGYRVVSVWEHELKGDLTGCVAKIIRMAKPPRASRAAAPAASLAYLAVNRYRETHRAAGLCIYCPNKALPGITLCKAHNKKNADRRRRRGEPRR